MYALFSSSHGLKLTLKPLCIQKTFYKSKQIIKKTDMQQIRQGKCENYNYTHLKRLIACVNDLSKVKLHVLMRPLSFISLGTDLLDLLDQRITDLLLETNRSKHLTFKY